MKRNNMVIFLSGILLALMLAAIPLMGACTPEEEGPKVITWKQHIHGSPTSSFTLAITARNNAIEKVTNGRLMIDEYPGSVLSTGKEALDSVAAGVVELAEVSPAYFPDRLSLFRIMYLPFRFTDRLDWNSLICDEVGTLESTKAQLAMANSVYGFAQLVPPYEPMGNVLISKAEDFDGVRVRCPADAAEVLKQFGAVPMMVPAADTYTSLDTGVIDLVFGCSDYWHKAYKIYEASKYYMPGMALGVAGDLALINKDAWDALPKDLQVRLPELRIVAAQTHQMELASPEKVAAWRVEFEAAGIEIIPFPAAERAKLEAAAKSVWDEWMAKYAAVGANEVMAAYPGMRDKIMSKYPDGV